jgi:hypothetical protein
MSIKTLKTLLLLLLAASLAFGAVACGSACKDLGNKICDCQPTRAKEDSCELALDTAVENFDLSSSQENACQDILDSGECTCEALQAGDLAACGLANDAQVVFD